MWTISSKLAIKKAKDNFTSATLYYFDACLLVASWTEERMRVSYQIVVRAKLHTS